jgi:antitoxin HigA-1
MSISPSLTAETGALPMALPARPRQRPPFHPGAVAADILDEQRVSLRGAAKALGMTHSALDKVLKGVSPVTVDTALRFGVYFGNGPDLWLDLQNAYDIDRAKVRLAASLRAIKPLPHD